MAGLRGFPKWPHQFTGGGLIAHYGMHRIDGQKPASLRSRQQHFRAEDREGMHSERAGVVNSWDQPLSAGSVRRTGEPALPTRRRACRRNRRGRGPEEPPPGLPRGWKPGTSGGRALDPSSGQAQRSGRGTAGSAAGRCRGSLRASPTGLALASNVSACRCLRRRLRPDITRARVLRLWELCCCWSGACRASETSALD